MNHTPTVYALVTLVAVLAVLGVATGSTPIISMASAALTGMFAFLQVHGRDKEDR